MNPSGKLVDNMLRDAKKYLESFAHKAPQDDALALAQQRAALPVEQGGLGLGPNNTPMERADIMFPEEGWHGTTRDFTEFKERGRVPIYASDRPEIANIYAELGDRGKDTGMPPNAGPNVIPLRIGGRALEVSDIVGGQHGWLKDNLEEVLGQFPQHTSLKDKLASGGYDRLRATGMSDLGDPMQIQHMVPEAKNLRSRFAAFDPFRRHESDLLAALGPYAVPAAVAGLAGASMTPSEAEAGIAGALAKTADKDMLKLAKQAEAGGLPMHKVYDATGWAKGADGKWRFEFDDQVTFNRQGDPGFERLRGPLFDKKLRGRFEQGAVNSPTWQAAYPNMKDINVYWRDEPGWPEGAVKGSHMAKHVDPNGRSVPESIIGQSNDSYKSVVHEMQHGAQNREGFEKGGSPSEFMDGATTPEEAHNNYLTLAGEVEARNVQNRMGWDADRRRMQPFFETEDTPRYLQIVRGAASSLSPSYAEASIRRGLRKSDREAMTHYAPKPMSAGGKAARDMAVEMMNPASWPLLWGSRELGRPEDLKFTNGAWSSR